MAVVHANFEAVELAMMAMITTVQQHILQQQQEAVESIGARGFGDV